MKRLFKNKKTQEVFILTGEDANSFTLVSLHDGKWSMIGESARNDFEEISVAPVKVKAVPTKIRTIIQTDVETDFNKVQEILNGTDLLAEHFRVNDVFYIPVKNQEEAIPFEIVHVEEDDRAIYLMSKDILVKKPIKNGEAREWLDKFGWSLPDDIFKHLKPIEHINRNGRYSSLVSMPSIANMGRDEAQCTGADDIKFDKFKDEASRCKNYDNETCWYWTDTPFASGSTFWNVYYNGNCYGSGASTSFGVCPILKLSKDEQKKTIKKAKTSIIWQALSCRVEYKERLYEK